MFSIPQDCLVKVNTSLTITPDGSLSIISLLEPVDLRSDVAIEYGRRQTHGDACTVAGSPSEPAFNFDFLSDLLWDIDKSCDVRFHRSGGKQEVRSEALEAGQRSAKVQNMKLRYLLLSGIAKLLQVSHAVQSRLFVSDGCIHRVLLAVTVKVYPEQS